MNHGSEIASKISTSLRIYTIFFCAIVSRSSFYTIEAWHNCDHVAKNTRPFSDSRTLPQEAVEAMLKNGSSKLFFSSSFGRLDFRLVHLCTLCKKML